MQAPNFAESAPDGIDHQFKQVYEENMTDLVRNMSVISSTHYALQSLLNKEVQRSINQSHIEKANQDLKQYLKTNYKYDFCTTCIKMGLKALQQSPELRKSTLGVESEYVTLVREIEAELSKFGCIEQLRIPKLGEPDEGFAFVRFSTISSSFCCYNLLNGKPYMGKEVEILFVNSI